MLDSTRHFSVRGRFQPFHNGHLNYVRAALGRCEFLYIGITQVERRSMKVFHSAPHRSEIASNPLSFFERKVLIERGLVSEGIPSSCFSVIPFPIEKSETLPEFFPLGSTCFTTMHSEWNRTKIDMLAKLGYEVIVLEESDRSPLPRASATKIRELIRSRDKTWKNLVPVAIGELIEQHYLTRFWD